MATLGGSASVAQLVEHFTRNEGVSGSNPLVGSPSPGAIITPMAHVHPTRHLLRAKDLADARYFEPLTVDDLASAANLSKAHFIREFKRAFGEPPTRGTKPAQLQGNHRAD